MCPRDTWAPGRGEFSMHFERYEAVPYAIAEEIVAARREVLATR